jgi:predicted DNA-binding transcriptional regulator AlpA
VLGELEEYLKPAEVAKMLGVDTSTIHRWRKDPKQNFPKPINISHRIVVFREADILKWIEGKAG